MTFQPVIERNLTKIDATPPGEETVAKHTLSNKIN
jgi:hypothetical protein